MITIFTLIFTLGFLSLVTLGQPSDVGDPNTVISVPEAIEVEEAETVIQPSVPVKLTKQQTIDILLSLGLPESKLHELVIKADQEL